MDHDVGGLGGREEGRRQGRFRRGGRIVEASRSAGESFDLSGYQRKRGLEGARDSLSAFFEARRHRMTIRRREFLTLAGAAALSPALPRLARAAADAGVYDLERFGNARILHMTDTHAQPQPV